MVKGKGSEGVLDAQPVIRSGLHALNIKNVKKLQQYLITGPKLGGGGVRGTSAKSQSITFFKPSLTENGA